MKKRKLLYLLPLPIIVIPVIIYNTLKSLPEGLSFEGKTHYVDRVDFLYDLTYQTNDGNQMYDQTIFDEIFKMIEKSEEFIIVDMFLFNDYVEEDKGYPKLSSKLTEALIKQKQKFPAIQIVFITDPVNTGYYSYDNKFLERMRAHDIDVIITSLDELRDSNPVYSGVWRLFLKPFGQKGKGWLGNSISPDAPNITLRSYLKVFNIKANHRKVIATEKEAIISSANPHDESGFSSNIAFKVSGEVINDIIASEQAVIDYSLGKHHVQINQQVPKSESGSIALTYLTEGKIYKHVLKEINEVTAEDEIWLGMFYLADRGVIDALTQAADRGTEVRMVLDANKVAFGHQKTGLPNLVISSQLIDHPNIDIRWYNSDEEQYHTKLLFIKKEQEGIIIGGSSNYTTRNLDDLNLESDIKIEAPLEASVMKDIDAYFQRIWHNKDGIYTVEYEEYQDMLTPMRELTYWVQKLTGLTTY